MTDLLKNAIETITVQLMQRDQADTIGTRLAGIT
jgi:hypothetical protein